MQGVADGGHHGPMCATSQAGSARTTDASVILKHSSRPNSRSGKRRLIERRIREAHLPCVKTLVEVDFGRNSKVSAQEIHEAARGDYIAIGAGHLYMGQRSRTRSILGAK